MYAVIDIGSNTIRLIVYQVEEDGTLRAVFQTKDNTGLAGYITPSGLMSDEGLDRAEAVLLRFQDILDRLSIENRAAFATASLRNITNTEQAVARLQADTGFSIRVLSGREEALLDYVGVTHALELDRGMILDIGGGSTEWVCFDSGKIRHAASIPLGSLNLYTRCVSHLLPTEKEQEKMRKKVKKQLERAAFPKLDCPVLCGVGGTIRAAGKLCRSLYGLPADNKIISLDMIHDILARFSTPNRENLHLLLKIVPERVHTLLPGLEILATLARRSGGETVRICSSGVREGFLLKEVLQHRSVSIHE